MIVASQLKWDRRVAAIGVMSSHYSFINVGSIVFMVKHMYPGRITRRGCAVLLLSYRLLSHRMFLCVPLRGFV